MDPLTMAMMGLGMQGQQAAHETATAAPQSGFNPDSLDPILGAVKGMAGAKPVFSGGINGVGLPFLQAMPNLLTPALSSSMARIGQPPAAPSLGALIGGGR